MQSLGASASTLEQFANSLAKIAPELVVGVGSSGRITLKQSATSGNNQGKSSPLPVPEGVVASNGLSYKSNQKHTPGMMGYSPRAGTEPRNSLELFENSVSISVSNARFARDNDGNIHRFFEHSPGEFHWSGSTGDTKAPLKITNQ